MLSGGLTCWQLYTCSVCVCVCVCLCGTLCITVEGKRSLMCVDRLEGMLVVVIDGPAPGMN